MKIVIDRTRNISRLKALLDKCGHASSGDFTTYVALERIRVEGLPDVYVGLIQKYRDLISHLTKKIHEVNKEIDELSQYDLDVMNLMSIPGIASFSANLIKSEIIDIKRFSSFNRLCAYAGLAPRVSASANKIYHGALNVNRRKNLQWILLENVYHFIKSDPKRLDKFETIKKRKGHNTAKVILARDFLKIVYHVLKEHRPYVPSGEMKIQSVAATALLRV
jgi:transposase